MTSAARAITLPWMAMRYDISALVEACKRDESRGCLLWQRATTHSGYGVFSNKVLKRTTGRGTYPAHRVMWELMYGPIPKGMFVLHRCDVPRCIEPTHLFLGTQRDNMMDMDRKGRRRWGRKKLTWEQVCEIRRRQAAGEKQVTLQREYGVSEDVILGIKKGRYWKRPMPEILPWGS